MGITQDRDKDAILRVAKKAASEWGFQTDLQELGDCENVVYKACDKNGTPFILRVTEPIHRSARDITSELDYIDFLKSEGLNVCASVRHPKSKSKVHTCEDPISQKTYHICVTEYAPGELPQLKKHWSANLARQLGTMMAEFKTANIKYAGGQSPRHSYFENEHVKNALEYIPKNDTRARAEWQHAMTWVKSLPQTKDNFGLCHSDLHARNFFIDKNNDLHVFDFDDACNNFYLYDAMIPFLVIGLEDKKLKNPTPQEFQDIYLKAYADKLDITDVQQLKKDIRNFERLRNIEMYAWCHMMGYSGEDNLKNMRDQMKPGMAFTAAPNTKRKPPKP